MVRLGLDDTLHAIVQVTHEHGLPLRGVDVSAGRAQVFTDAVDLPRWVGWLTDPAAEQVRPVVWRKGPDETAFVLSASCEGIEWTVTATVSAAVAGPVLAGHDVTVTGDHRRVSAAAAVALAAAHATNTHRQVSHV